MLYSDIIAFGNDFSWQGEQKTAYFRMKQRGILMRLHTL